MNFLRIRAIKFKEQYGRDNERPFAVQVSQAGLDWFTIATFPTENEAKETACRMHEAAMASMGLLPSHILCVLKMSE